MTAANEPATDSGEQDLSAINDEEWMRRRLPVRARSEEHPVIVARSVLNDIHAHGKGDTEIEVCGILVGNVYRDGQRAFVHIEHCIRGNHATSKATQVTFTADTWTSVQQTLESRYPDKRILGWYHTHPGYGVFLSDMDVFIHKNFFSLPWHTAFVYDPQANEEGLFVWRGGALSPQKFLIHEDTLPDTLPVRMQHKEQATSTAAPPGTVLELTARVQALEQRQKWLLAGIALSAMLAIAVPLLVSVIAPMLRNEQPALSGAPSAGELRQHDASAATNDSAPVTGDAH